MESTAAAIYAAWMLPERAIFEDDPALTLSRKMSTRFNPLFPTNVLNDPVQGAAVR